MRAQSDTENGINAFVPFVFQKKRNHFVTKRTKKY